MSKLYNKIFVLTVFVSGAALFQQNAWALSFLNYSLDSLSNQISHLYRELEKFEQKSLIPPQTSRFGVDALTPEHAPNLIDTSEEEFPALGQNLREQEGELPS
ncbi:MAG: hypothetical protein HY559_01355 [Gammaproteobacteria bacterium]|nr:hypothetical protein [Gammaproteobacteria bacterium]